MRGLLIVILMLLIVSCTTSKIIEKPVPVETIKTEYINKYHKDSIFIRDSVDRYIKGDSIFITKYKNIYRQKTEHDTLIVRDSVEIPVEVKVTEIKEVNNIKWYQEVLMWLGGVALIILSFKLGRKLKRIK